jgi:hypothetical protein
MKAKIDAHGWLHLERAGQWKIQKCPFSAGDGTMNICGDWCPLFYEGFHVYLSCAPNETEYDVGADERPRPEAPDAK